MTPLALGVALIIVTSSCSSSSKEHDAAMTLLQQADSAICTRDYDGAINLLDTLKASYPREIDVQRQALAMRPRAIEGLTIVQIEEADSLQAYYSAAADSLRAYFTLVHDKDLGSDYDYYVVKECKGRDLFDRTGVEGRVSPSGEFYVISSLTAKPVKHTSIALTGSDGSSVTSATVDYDGERNYRSGATEMITFTGAECDTLGSYLLTLPAVSKVKLTFRGQKDYTIPLDKADRLSLQRAYQLGLAISSLRKTESRRQLLERQLALARDQQARTSL